ncbi:MAG TPA: VWA domain-containing protein [Candidatus Binatia bacterium]|nr:VWA domain-containing protein [Candidatus Binatia bacterium]
MPSLRHLWFDNRHLLGDAAGQALLAALEALSPRSRETILNTGDRLAAISLTLAQAFCRTAPAAWQAFGVKRFSRWVRIGEHLAVEEPSSRDGAAAYFAIDPHVLARLGLEFAEEWAAIGRDTLKVSRRLGTQFLQTSAPLLATLPEPLPQRLRAWATHGNALLGAKGWKGEFLAVAYFEAAPVALPVLTGEEMAEWAKLGLLVQDSGPWTFYAKLPRGFAALTVLERLSLLRDCQAAATLSVKAAEESFFCLPPVLAAQSAELRAFLLAVLAPVLRTDPAAVPPLVPLLAPLLKAVGLDQQPALRAQLVALAQEFPAGVSSLLRALPRAWEETDEQGLTSWLAKGLAIARDNPAAGVAFFALESRTSEKVLRQASPGVDLEEVQELLRKYIHMLSGTTVGIRRQETFSYPPPLEDFPTYSDDLPLPARVDLFSTHEENFRLFRVLAVQQAGRREFGTYDFSLSTLWPRLPMALRQLLGEEENPVGGLGDYFRRFPHPDVVEALFLLLETQRVSLRISDVYRGLHEDLRWAGSLALPSLLPDVLVAITSAMEWPSHQHLTVHDSALLAGETYLQLLSSLAAARQTHDPAAFGSIVFDKVTGDALIDPEMDDSPPPADTPELPPLELDPEADDREGGTPLSPEELKALLEAGVDLQIRQGKQDTITPQGLYVSDLIGKLPSNGEREHVAPEDGLAVVNRQRRREREEGLTFFYDEWDYQIADYRSRWCRLREIVLAGDAGEYFAQTLNDYATLRPAVKHEFQRIRPEQYRLVRGLEDGEEFDLNAVVTAASDLRARVSPSPKLYTTRRQTERDVAALFLLDMSASTDEPIVPVTRQYTDEEQDDWLAMWKKRPPSLQPTPRRIIDVTKEALVLMAEALEEIGDSYAIYGFSGQGRDNVEFYHVKSFAEVLSSTVKGRIGAIAPKRSTRMGTALRHAFEKLKDLACRVKLLVLLSDGFPQDMDYGADRRSITYGVRDTMMALREADRAGVLTFCLTVDKAGHDYLREMCEPSRYLVLEDVASLPTELPKVYQRYIRPRGV